MNLLIQIVFFMLLSALSGCKDTSKKDTDSPTKTYICQPEVMHKTLFFNGTIQPLHEHALVSPVSAVIENMSFHYGQRMQKDEIIMTLSSHELQKEYNETLTNYLKAKDSYMSAKAKFAGTTELWEAGLFAKNNYLNEKSSLDTTRVSFIQAKHHLHEILQKMEGKQLQQLSALSLAEFTKVEQALAENHQKIHLKSPFAGVLLYPPQSNDEKNSKLTVGSSVKEGQVLAIVGDLTGIRIEIDIPEVDINKIYPEMKAIVTGVALDKHTLHGKLVAINAQANTTGANGLPSFNAVVEVANLTTEARKRIKVGMSASIALQIDTEKQLMVPIEAIHHEKGQSLIKVRATNGTVSQRVITTGDAQADKVIVLSGLSPGDTVVYA